MRLLTFEGDSWNEYEALRIADKKAHNKLRKIIKEMLQRLIYYFNDTFIYIVAVGGHYEDK